MNNARRTARSMIGLAVTALALSSHLPNVFVRADEALNVAVVNAFAEADPLLEFLREVRLPTADNFTSYTDENGEWLTISTGSGKPLTQTVWTSGMVAGMFWYQYEITGDERFKVFAEYTLEGLEGVELLDDNDTGFQVLYSFGHGYRLTGNAAYLDRVLAGADTLFRNRYVSIIPAYWSWRNPSRRPDWWMAVNVDMIMNMEIMAYASVLGGNETYLDSTIEHADSTWEYLVRPDYSTYHVADFDNVTGELTDQGTYQGWQDNSTWSRGQAWGIHGYTILYRYTGLERFLERAALLLTYFDVNLESDNVPLADFDAPKDDINPRDSSSTAIVASALLELFQLTGDATYLELGQTYLRSLLDNTDYFNPFGGDGWEALLRASASEHGVNETGSVTGDYYFLEAMVRYRTMSPSILLRNHSPLTVTDDELTRVFSREDLYHDTDLSSLNVDSVIVIWFQVTLSNTVKVPSFFQVGDIELEIEAPSYGWATGLNTLHIVAPAGIFSGLDTVESIAVVFMSSESGSTVVTFDSLVVGHRFNTMLEEDSGDNTYGTGGNNGTTMTDHSTTTSDEENGRSGSETETDYPSDAANIPCADLGVTGTEGDSEQGVCCHESCPQCGGVGCSSSALSVGLTEYDCCARKILASDVMCEDTLAGPCIK